MRTSTNALPAGLTRFLTWSQAGEGDARTADPGCRRVCCRGDRGSGGHLHRAWVVRPPPARRARLAVELDACREDRAVVPPRALHFNTRAVLRDVRTGPVAEARRAVGRDLRRPHRKGHARTGPS